MKRTVLIQTALLCCCATFAQQAFFDQIADGYVVSSDNITWTQEGPGNGGMCDLVRYHPNHPDTCFFGPDMGANYQSDNNGLSFYDVRDFDDGGGFGRLRDVQYSVSNNDVALALETSRLRVSSDRGKTWTIVTDCPWYTSSSDGTDGSSWVAKASAIAIDPTDSDVWYVGAGKHPHGQIWSSCMKEATQANPYGGSCDVTGQIFKTTDGGATWSTLTSGIHANAQFCRIIVNPYDAQQVFAASNYGLYRSDNGGTTWTDIGAGKLANDTIWDLDVYDSGTGITLYLINQVRYFPSGSTTTYNGGIFKSTDLGATWENITGNLALDLTQLSGWGVSSTYYNYMADWFGITSSEAKTLYPDMPTNALQPVQLIRADPSAPGTIYVGLNDPQGELASFGPGPLWKTTDGGTTWIMATRGHGPAFENDQAYWNARGNPINENMIFGHEVFNQQWGDEYPQRTMRYFDINTRGEIMLISGHNALISTNRGETFEQVDEYYTENGNLVGRGNSDLPGETLKQDVRLRSGQLYLGSGEHRLWKTTLDDIKGKVAMKQQPTMDTVTAIALHPDDTNIVFVTSNRQHAMDEIWRSTDGGDSWSKWGDTTGATANMRTKALTIDPSNPSYMYFGVTDRNSSDWDKPGGFYYSSDGGVSFTARNTGLPANPRVNDIVFDPRDSSFQSMFIAAQKRTFQVPASNEGGLYYTADRGETWTEIPVDAEVDGVNELKLDQGGRLWITTGHRTSSTGGLWYSDDYGTSWTKSFVSPCTDSVDVSPFNSNLVVISVSELSKNPGIYLSEDRGMTWTKNNRTISINTRISEVEFSVHDPEVLWMSCVGAGFFKGTYRPYGDYAFEHAQDVGSITTPGTMEKVGGSYIINGNGTDIQGGSDKMFYASQDWSGDCDMVARVVEVENTDYWAKAGVMIRESLAANAANVTVLVVPNRQITMQVRSATGGSTTYTARAGDTSTIKWIRVVREGDQFSGYYSTDKQNWTLIDTVTVSMPADTDVGLAVTSHTTDGTLCEAAFSDVLIRKSPTHRIRGEVVDADIQLKWDATTLADSYTVSYCTNLVDGTWIPAKKYPAMDETFTFDDPADKPAKFYRVEQN